MNKKVLLVNLITFIRLLGILCLYPIYKYLGTFYLAIFVTFFLLTDSIDGFLARRLHASTFFGAIFDAISDKLFNIMILIIVSLINKNMLIVLLFEISILIISIINTFKGNKSKTLLIGKIKMVILSILIISILFLDSYPTLIDIFNLPMIDYKYVINIISIICIIIDLINFIIYLINDIYQTIENKNINKTIFDYKIKSKEELIKLLFDTKFYEENKNEEIEKLIKE